MADLGKPFWVEAIPDHAWILVRMSYEDELCRCRLIVCGYIVRYEDQPHIFVWERYDRMYGGDSLELNVAKANLEYYFS